MQKVKLAIIGCGLAARTLHWPALKELRDKFEIVAVCNHTEEKARELAKLVGGVPYETDYLKILRIPEVEAVDITLPIHMNYPAVCQAVKAGKHIIVEKPIAANPAEAKQMLMLERNYPYVTMVAENYRYRPIYRQAKMYLERGEIGEVCTVLWNFIFNVFDPGNLFGQVKWRFENKHEGAFITDFGVHPVSVLRDLFGDLTITGAFSRDYPMRQNAPEALSFQFVSQDRVCGVMNAFLNSGIYKENKMVILGREGCITIENYTCLTVQRSNKETLVETFENDNGIKSEFEDFYQAVRTGEKVKSTFFEAYNDLKTVIDALRISVNA